MMTLKLKLLLLTGSLSLVIAAFFYGVNVGKTDAKAQWQASQLAIKTLFETEQQRLARETSRVRQQLFEVEQAWLNDQNQTRVEYRDRIQTITRLVESDSTLDACRLDGERLQRVQDAIMHANDY